MGLVLFGTVQTFSQCVKGNCSSGHGTYIFEDGSKYVGDFKLGYIWGKGIFYYPNGDKYLGDWKKNQKHGKGKLVFQTGEEYVGQFRKDGFHGEGRFSYRDGRTLYGNWKDNQPTGQAHLEYADGKKVLGSWQNGLWVSKETVEEVNNESVVEASLKNCNTHKCHQEEGAYVYSDGSRYEGWFVDGKPQGEGLCTYASGDKYVGGWKNHSPHGKGIMYFATGRVYGAQWQFGKPVRELQPEESTDMLQNIMPETSEESKVWAVVIGVSRYTHMPVLNYSDDDAYRFYAFLKSPEGGAVPDEQIALLIDEDATRQNILSRMQETVFKADENDIVMVYFSGHGLKGSFIPIDFDGFNNQVAYEDMKSILDKSQARYKMCFADACHSGSLMAQKGVEETIDLYYGSFDQVEAGTAFMLSSKAEEFSLEDGGLRQGVFSHYLIRGIKGAADVDRNKVITIGELYNYVRFEVRKYSGNLQTPMMIGQYDQNMPVGVLR